MSCKSGFRAPRKLLTCCSFAQKLNCCWQAAGGGSWGVAGHGGACRCSGLVRGCVGGLGGGQQGRQLRWQWHWRQRRQQCVAAASAAATAATAGGGARAGMAGGRGWGQHAALGGALFIRAASRSAPRLSETKGHGPRPELITLGLACNTPQRRPWNICKNTTKLACFGLFLATKSHYVALCCVMWRYVALC